MNLYIYFAGRYYNSQGSYVHCFHCDDGGGILIVLHPSKGDNLIFFYFYFMQFVFS